MSARRSLQDGKQSLQSASFLAFNLPQCGVKMFVMIEIEKEGMGMRKRKIWRSRGLAVLLSATMAINGVPGVGSEGLFSPVVKAAEGETPSEPDQTKLSLTDNTTGSLAENGISYEFSAGTLTLKGSGALTTKFNETFSNCDQIKKIVFESNSNIISIGSGVFQDCTALVDVDFLGNGESLTSIGQSAFKNCTDLVITELPSGVKSVSAYAFQGCSSIEFMDFPKTVETLGIGSFSNCELLTNIAIHNPTMRSAYGKAFEGCDNIERIEFDGTESQWNQYMKDSPLLTNATIQFNKYELTYDAITNGGWVNVDGAHKETYTMGNLGENDKIPTKEPAEEGATKALQKAISQKEDEGYQFIGWAASPNATKPYEVSGDGYIYTITNQDATLYAIFKKDITANFIGSINKENANDNNPTCTDEQITQNDSNKTGSITKTAYNTATTVTITLPEGKKATSNATDDLSFVAWSTSSNNRTNVVNAGEPVTISQNTNYYAVYQQDVKVSYNTEEESLTLKEGTTLPKPSDVIKFRYYVAQPGTSSTTYKVVEPPEFTLADALTVDGYNFKGWKKDTTNTVYNAGQQFKPDSEDKTAGYTFTAQWEAEEAEKPVITTQPSNVTTEYGITGKSMQVIIEPMDENSYTIGFEWYKQGNPNAIVSEDSNIKIESNQTFSKLTFKNAKEKVETNNYYCKITATRTDNHKTATTTSQMAALTVEKAKRTVTVNDIKKIFNNKPIDDTKDIKNQYSVKPENSTKDIKLNEDTETDISPTITYYTVNAGHLDEMGSDNKPKDPGVYKVKVAYEETKHYKAAEGMADVVIEYLPTPSDAYTLSYQKDDSTSKTLQSNEWSPKKVIIKPADGYEIIQGAYKESNGTTKTFAEKLEISDLGSTVVTAYLQNTGGEITDKLTIPVKIDQTFPTGTVQVESKKWQSLFNTLTFGILFNNAPQTVTITGEDKESGLDKIQYCEINPATIDEKNLGNIISGTDTNTNDDLIQAIKNKTELVWKDYTGVFSIPNSANYVIIAKITDKVGNVTYINTDGVIIDTQAPTLAMRTAKAAVDETNNSNDKVTVDPDKDVAAGDIVYGRDVELTISDPNLSTVTIDNIIYNCPETLTGNATSGFGKDTVNKTITYKGTLAHNENKVHIISAKDSAGNILDAQTISVYDVYTISFDNKRNGADNSSTPIANQYVGYNNKAKAPTEKLTKAGHTFKGWSTTGNEPVFDFATPITSHLTFQPIWQKDVYTVIFNSDGGSECANKSVTFEEKYGSLPTPTKTGYNFQGWFSKPEGNTESQEIGPETPVGLSSTGTITLDAKWQPNTYQIHFNLNGGKYVDGTISSNSISSIDAIYDAPYPVLKHETTNKPLDKSTIQKDGYAFDGWYTEQTGGNLVLTGEETEEQLKTKKYTIAAHTTLYAHWVKAQYKVSLDYRAGNTDDAAAAGTASPMKNPEPITVTYQEYYEPLETISTIRPGYTFDGWYTAATGGNLVTDKTQVTKTTTHAIYAHWTANTYKVVLKVNEGVFEDDKDSKNITVTYDQNFTALSSNQPTRAGYNFAGWYTEQENGTVIGSSDRVQDYNSGGKNINITGSTDSNPLTLYAHWTAKTYNILLNAQDGEFSEDTAGEKTLTVTYDQKFSDLDSDSNKPTKAGYTFEGWNTTTDGTGDDAKKIKATDTVNDDTVPISKTTVDNPLKLYAQWTANKYTIVLNAQGGKFSDNNTEETNVDVIYDQTFSVLDSNKPTREGYIFTGWSTKANGTDSDAKKIEATDTVNDATVPITNTTDTTPLLYAQWTAENYTVTFDANGGAFKDSTPPTLPVTFAGQYTSIDTITKPTKPGFKFKGWYTVASDENDNENNVIIKDSDVTIASDHTLYAHWTATVIEFDTDTSKFSHSAEYGQPINDWDFGAIQNGTGNYNYEIVGGNSLPEGLKLDVKEHKITGTVKVPANTYTFKVKVNDAGNGTSAEREFKLIVVLAGQEKPTEAPTAKRITSNSIELDTKTGWQYACLLQQESDVTKIVWNETGSFTELTSGKEYHIYARKKAVVGQMKASEPIETIIKTLATHKITFKNQENKATIEPASPPENWTANRDGTYTIDEGSDLTFRIVFIDKYGKTNNFKVEVDPKPEGASNTNITASLSSANTYTIRNIKEDYKITVSGAGDADAPTGTITVKDSSGRQISYGSVQNSIQYKTYLNNTGEITVQAKDNLGIPSVGYYISDKMLSQDQLKDNTNWTELSSLDENNTAIIPLTEQEDGRKVIYVKLVDGGNNTTYLSTNGIIYDNKLPIITFAREPDEENGGVYNLPAGENSLKFTVTEQNLKSVTVDGATASIGNDGKYYVPLSYDNPAHTVKVVDYAGNEAVENISLYRQRYTVTFQYGESDSNKQEEKVVYVGERVAEPLVTARENMIFDGWQTEDGEIFDFSQPVTEDVTLTQKWSSIPNAGKGKEEAKEVQVTSSRVILEEVEGCTYLCSNGVESDMPVFDNLIPGQTYYFYVIDANGNPGKAVQITTKAQSECALTALPSTLYQGQSYKVSPNLTMQNLVTSSVQPENTMIAWTSNMESVIEITTTKNGTEGCTIKVKNVPYNKDRLTKVTISGTVYYYTIKNGLVKQKIKTVNKRVSVQNLSSSVDVDLEQAVEKAGESAVVSNSAICLLDKTKIKLNPIINKDAVNNIATNKKVKWFISDKDGKTNSKGKKIATVSSKGVLRGVRPGETYVTVATVDSYNKTSKTYAVKKTFKVVCPWIQSIRADSKLPLTAAVGDTAQLRDFLIMEPEELFNEKKMKIKWKSDDRKVARVTSKGKVTFKSAGTVTITVTPTGGQKIDASTGRVAADADSLALSLTFTVGEGGTATDAPKTDDSNK